MPTHKIAVISDTHNLLRPEIFSVLEECEVILHAGDISTQEIYDRLKSIKEIYAVRGNNDRNLTVRLPLVRQFELYGFRICMTHIKRNIPSDHNADLVIYGHSHRYSCTREGDTLYLNPGSCGPRRFNQDITMAVLTLNETEEAGEPNNSFMTQTGVGMDAGRRMYVERIDIPHETPSGKDKPHSAQEMKNLLRTTLSGSSVQSGQSSQIGNKTRRNIHDSKRTLTTTLIRLVCYDVDHERTVDEIAERRRIDPELTDQIVRMYLTHQGVTPEQIMTKLGL